MQALRSTKSETIAMSLEWPADLLIMDVPSGRSPATAKSKDCALPAFHRLCEVPRMDEIIFEVREDEVDGGFVATAVGHSIATQGETLEEIREMACDAVRCHFGDGTPGPMPKIIRLHFVRDEALAV